MTHLIRDTTHDLAQTGALKQLSLGLAVLGLCCGFLLSYGVLAGDAEGRVNLLFLLLLFALLPVAGLVLSLLLLVRGGGKGLSGWIFDIPLWPRHLTLALPRLGSHHGRELWLFYQTQILVLSFAVGSLLLYLLLLLGSDITFVWRSTLLEPTDLLPTLRVLGTPWRFWPEAQASLALVEQTQDYRLDAPGMAQPVVGLWWKYILAAQITYNLLPRSVMLVVTRWLYLQRLRQSHTLSVEGGLLQEQTDSAYKFELANLVSVVTAPYALLDWAHTPAMCHAQVQQQLGDAVVIQQIGPVLQPVLQSVLQPGLQQPEKNLLRSESIVVLVKSWEPPMAELADRLRAINSRQDQLILPLDWNNSGLRQPTTAHLDEWRRFAATLSNWRVLRLAGDL